MQQIEAGERFIREFAKYTPLRAAFWLKASADNQWFLYLVGDRIDDSNFNLAYTEVIRIAAMMPDIWLDPFQIKVMGTGKPVAKAAIEVQEQYNGRLPARYYGPPLGDITIEEVYIYSPEQFTAQPYQLPGKQLS